MTTLIEKKAQEYAEKLYPLYDPTYPSFGNSTIVMECRRQIAATYIAAWRACREAIEKEFMDDAAKCMSEGDARASIESEGTASWVKTFGDEQIAGDEIKKDEWEYTHPTLYIPKKVKQDDPHNYNWVDATGVGP